MIELDPNQNGDRFYDNVSSCNIEGNKIIFFIIHLYICIFILQ